MAPPRVERLLTAIDVGSSKVAVLIAGQTADGTLHALGTGVRESLGVKRGYVVDIPAVDRSVREALEQAERMAGIEVQHAWVSFGGGSLTSRIIEHEDPFNRGQIEPEDVDELLARARSQYLRDDRAILHAQPTLYTLDGNHGIKDPVGLFADRFGVAIHMVEADRGPVSNLVTAVRAAHVDIREVVATMMATGRSSLTEEQRDLGTALVDIGASLTNIGLFAGGMLVGIATISAGGNDITDDIANEFGTRRSQAERLKCFYGSAMSSPRDHQDQLDIGTGDEDEGGRPKITRAQLNAVIRKRLDHFVPQIGEVLKQLGDGGPGSRQVVLTGGTSELKGMADYVQNVLGGSARTARPSGVVSLPSANVNPAFSTAVGLVLYAADPPEDIRPVGRDRPEVEGPQRWWRRMMAMWDRGK
ncbi:cell division protein FtsA [Sphingomonas lacunae]|uniref:Cell division protein FtsA n=1 Tax=Sphingomonas lacunae TaxID=2698828 RepID=A0A6M4AY59_9SPHN|nr:cell division protein FtsA [Sphingomonas lacunae]QJQ33300.1 cell division protein FtsA [Sphingomonas lacunae]